jgi:hypothetical protein
MTFNTMTVLCRTLLCSALFAVAACGGAEVTDEGASDDLAVTGPFEPLEHFAAAQKLATKYAKNPVAVALHGARTGDAMQTNAGAYTWTWTLMGEGGMYVDVVSGPKGNKVVAHEKRYTFAGMGTFVPSALAVNGDDVVQLVMKAGLTQPSDLTLGAGLTHPMVPTWNALCGKKTAQVDATTGTLQK